MKIFALSLANLLLCFLCLAAGFVCQFYCRETIVCWEIGAIFFLLNAIMLYETEPNVGTTALRILNYLVVAFLVIRFVASLFTSSDPGAVFLIVLLPFIISLINIRVLSRIRET